MMTQMTQIWFKLIIVGEYCVKDFGRDLLVIY